MASPDPTTPSPSEAARSAPDWRPGIDRQRFDAILANFPEAIILSRLEDGVILDLNAGWEHLTGFTKAECIGSRSMTLGLLTPEDREGALRLFKKESKLKGFEVTVRRKSGEVRWCELSAEIMNVDGAPCILTIMRDVTERKAAELELRTSEARFRLMTESIQDYSIVTLDPYGTVSSWNPAVRRIFGYEPDEVLGKPFSVFYAAAEMEAGRPQADLEEAKRSGRVESEGWRVRKDGTEFWGHSIMTSILGTDGSLVGFVRISRDTTAQRRSAEELRAKELLYRTLASHYPKAAVLLLDRDLRILVAEGAALESMGRRQSEMEGRLLKDVSGPERFAEIQTHYEEAVQGIGSIRSVESGGSHREVELIPIRDGYGYVWSVMVVVRDVTEERTFERLISDIASREQRRIGSELHDGICQELTGISLHIKALEGKMHGDAADRRIALAEISRMVNTSILHARALLSGLLPVGLERGLADGLRELASKFSRTYPAAFLFEGEDVAVNADVAAHLFRIAQEAATNAAKHARPREVRIRLERDQGALAVSVSDDGSGFVLGTPNEGRGLEIMRYRARLLGARLNILSQPGKGSTVTCTLLERSKWE